MPDITYLTGDLFSDTSISQANKTAGFLDFETRFATADLPTDGPMGALVKQQRERDAALAVLVREAIATEGGAQADQQQDHLLTAAQRTVALAFTERLDGFLTGIILDKTQRAALRTALFPQGRAALGEAKVDALPQLLTDVQGQLTKNLAAFGDFGPVLATQATAAFLPYTEARKAEVQQQGSTGVARQGVADLLPLISAALTDGLHLACLALVPHRERAALLFIDRFFKRQRVSNPAGVRRRALSREENRSLFDLSKTPGSAATQVTVKVAAGAGGPLLLGRAAEAGLAPEAATAVSVLPGEEQTFGLAALGAGPWLVARNAGPRKLAITVTLG